MDYTFSIYKSFLQSFISREYTFVTYKSYTELKNDLNNSLTILRHDVDRFPLNSLKTAEIEHSLGIKGSYYFRIVPESYDIEIMKKIAGLGHEVGYHYEDMDLAFRKQKSILKKQGGKIDEDKLVDLAYESFCNNLKEMRKLFSIITICAHGSPLSPYDNKLIWHKYDYKKLGISGEPTFDIDWNEFAYFTDTGRQWNGNNFNVRDKVNSKYEFNFKSTRDIISNINTLPDKIMITVHPQRWNENVIIWSKELLSQSAKNIIKKYFYVKN